MGSVVALDEFRQSLEGCKPARARPERPKISGEQIWGRDYREVEAIVFGLLTVRDLLAYHTGGHDQMFDHFCTNGLDAAYKLKTLGLAHLKTTIKPLKDWILGEIEDDNRRDLSWALVILDLIEKSPTRDYR